MRTPRAEEIGSSLPFRLHQSTRKHRDTDQNAASHAAQHDDGRADAVDHARILNLITDLGWPYEILWSADSGDWLEITPQEVRNRVNRAASNGAIIVQHCGSTQTATILPEILRDLHGKGFRLVTGTEILAD